MWVIKIKNHDQYVSTNDIPMERKLQVTTWVGQLPDYKPKLFPSREAAREYLKDMLFVRLCMEPVNGWELVNVRET